MNTHQRWLALAQEPVVICQVFLVPGNSWNANHAALASQIFEIPQGTTEPRNPANPTAIVASVGALDEEKVRR